MLPTIRHATHTPYLLAPYDLQADAAIHDMREAILAKRKRYARDLLIQAVTALACSVILAGSIIIAIACTNF